LPVKIAPVVPLGPNLLINPDFESGSSPWIFHTNGLGDLYMTPGYFSDGGANISTLFVPDTNVQFYQPYLVLLANTKYR